MHCMLFPSLFLVPLFPFSSLFVYLPSLFSFPLSLSSQMKCLKFTQTAISQCLSFGCLSSKREITRFSCSSPIAKFHAISYMYYSVFGVLVTFGVGLLVTFLCSKYLYHSVICASLTQIFCLFLRM